MNFSQVVFILLGIITLAGAAGVVLHRNLFRAALFLILSFVGVAGIYILLEAELLAMIQLLLYVGAIAILIIFAIMLSRQMMAPDFRARNEQWLWGLAVGVVLFGVLAYILLNVAWPVDPNQSPVPQDAIARLGEALVSGDKYVLPFEVASVLLLVALVGAVIIAREK